MLKKVQVSIAQIPMVLLVVFFMNTVYASQPLWTFTPDPNYPPTLSMTPVATATIKYLITNKTSKTQTLMMTPIAGINQITSSGNCPNPFTLSAQQSCTLTLLVTGSLVHNVIKGGPVLCSHGSSLECYQPAASDILNITLIPRAATFFAATASGHVYFSANNGLTWSDTTVPSNGNAVQSVFANSSTLYVGSADGKVYYSTNNGSEWNAMTSAPDGSAVNAVFVTTVNQVTTIFAGTQNGKVYSSIDGATWNASSIPGSASVNSIFITPTNTMYVGSADGNVYYSTNLGTDWKQIAGPTSQDPISVQNVFATNNQLYINTRQTSGFEYVYFSNSLTDANPEWNLLSQITYTLFVNADGSEMYAGTQGGYVFSLTTGNELGFITYSPITSLYFIG